MQSRTSEGILNPFPSHQGQVGAASPQSPASSHCSIHGGRMSNHTRVWLAWEGRGQQSAGAEMQFLQQHPSAGMRLLH